jgi:hypothetical protein
VDKARAKRLKDFFNLTEEEWDKINAYQKGVCFICGRVEKSGNRLATDHCHKTGRIRGLLSCHCNRLLGKIERLWTIDDIQRAIEYILHPPAVKALGREVFTFPGRLGTKRHKLYLKKQKISRYYKSKS